MYRIVTGVTSDVSVLSTYLVQVAPTSNFYTFESLLMRSCHEDDIVPIWYLHWWARIRGTGLPLGHMLQGLYYSAPKTEATWWDNGYNTGAGWALCKKSGKIGIDITSLPPGNSCMTMSRLWCLFHHESIRHRQPPFWIWVNLGTDHQAAMPSSVSTHSYLLLLPDVWVGLRFREH